MANDRQLPAGWHIQGEQPAASDGGRSYQAAVKHQETRGSSVRQAGRPVMSLIAAALEPDGCDACGAEPGEECRPMCIGQAAQQDALGIDVTAPETFDDTDATGLPEHWRDYL